MNKANIAGPAAAVAIIALGFPSPAHAYIDPATGSIILQVVAAGVLAAVFTAKRITFKFREAAQHVWKRFRKS